MFQFVATSALLPLEPFTPRGRCTVRRSDMRPRIFQRKPAALEPRGMGRAAASAGEAVHHAAGCQDANDAAGEHEKPEYRAGRHGALPTVVCDTKTRCTRPGSPAPCGRIQEPLRLRNIQKADPAYVFADRSRRGGRLAAMPARPTSLPGCGGLQRRPVPMTLFLCILGFYLAGAGVTYAALALAILSGSPGPSDAEARVEAGVSASAASSVQA